MFRPASRRRLLGSATALILTAGVALVGSDSVSATPRLGAHARPIQGNVVANLFEWNWKSVANECTSVLGPKGYAAVQVAPPQDSLSRTATDTTTVLHPWWEVYQPVDYNLTSRMGNEAQFKSMVQTCRGAGVKVIVDAVINHMTGQGSVSYGGVHYTKYDYPGLYSNADFHHAPADCPSADGNIDDFNNYTQVFKCELVSLSDLRTESSYVRSTLAGYLNKLLGYGVSGFRVDAAKHIGQTDLAAIEAKLHRTVDGERPYLALEVGTGSPGRISPQAFEGVGSPLGFDFASQLESAFKSYTNPAGGNLGDLKIFGEDSGLLPSDKSLAFVENHDTERNGSTLNYKDGALNTLATEFMLAYGYGTPEVYSGFDFVTSDDSPPADANGFVTDTSCGNGWECTDRITGVANLVAWHNIAGNAPVSNWYDDGTNLIAFSRGHRAWISINNEITAQIHTFATGLPAGRYCDVIHGNSSHGSCTGPTITVDRHGLAQVQVPAKDSVAIDVR
ncbi:MAG: alpha-amylase family protein [Actinomycetota bacterium]|nr:alpha-amylase family protein [Actinomycetota bacterium]MDQ2956784.1 alpha-amylase family protein [Actinomycetota bacterium]